MSEYTGGRTPDEVDALVHEMMTGEWQMTDRIEPALTAEEWARGGKFGHVTLDSWREHPERIPGTIALANAALPDSDPRKITRKMVDYLCELANDEDDARAMGEQTQVDTIRVRAIASALAAYLPPNQT